MSELSSSPHRHSRSGWWILGGLALCLLVVGLRFGLPIWRRAAAIDHVAEIGGSAITSAGGPEWLRKRLGESAMRGFDLLSIVALTELKVADETLLVMALFPELREVKLQGSDVSKTGFVALGAHPGLDQVDLFASSLDDEGLAALSKSKSIQGIFAGYTRVTDAGVSHLGSMTQLIYLGLRGNEVTDAGLAQLTSLTRLSDLNLAETRITDAGLRHIEPLKRLQHVWLFDTPVTEIGVLELLATHPDLETLHLSPDQISADGMDLAQRRRPKLNVVITVEENDGSGFSRRRRRE